MNSDSGYLSLAGVLEDCTAVQHGDNLMCLFHIRRPDLGLIRCVCNGASARIVQQATRGDTLLITGFSESSPYRDEPERYYLAVVEVQVRRESQPQVAAA